MSELSINPGIEIRDSERELQRFRGRLALLGIFVLVMFGLLFLRFLYLQVVSKTEVKETVEAKETKESSVSPSSTIQSLLNFRPR